VAKSLGTVLKRAREKRGLSVTALARQAGLSTTQLSELESGVAKEPRFSTIARLAYCLDLSLNALAADVGLPTINAAQTPEAAMGPALHLAHGLRKYLAAALKLVDKFLREHTAA